MKIRPVGAELLRPYRRADRGSDRHDELNSLFSQFGNAAKMFKKAFLSRSIGLQIAGLLV